VILAAVALFTAASALVFQGALLKARYSQQPPAGSE